jgi:hypothetical protein
MSSNKDGSRDKVLLGIAVTVTGVWVVATMVQIMFPSHQAPATVNVVMGMVVSALFGAAAVRAGRRNGGNGEP